MARTCTLCGNDEKPFFEFPHSARLRRKWFKILRKRYQLGKVGDRDVICVKHFRASNLIHGKNSIKLKTGAVPMILQDERVDSPTELTDESIPTTPPPESPKIHISSPVTVKEDKDEEFYYAEKDERIKLIMSKKFSFLQEQLPLKLSPNDLQTVKEIIYSKNAFKEATLQTKVHCTVCDTHLGASPIAQFDRFVHPVLNTLMCESCFVFYNTGEFTKDEDGSEIYCKWCAQGGTVMCCSTCPLVFCKLCVERNFGERLCEKIANADTWECFKCKPKQLRQLQIMCSAVHEYTLKIIKDYYIKRKNMVIMDKEALEQDISICCQEYTNIPSTNKRKSIVFDDGIDLDDIQATLRKRMKMSPEVNESLSTLGVTLSDDIEEKDQEATKAKRPPTPIKLRAIPTAQLQQPKTPKASNFSSFAKPLKALKTPSTAVVTSPIFTPSSSPPPLVPAFSLPLRSQYTISQEPPPLRPMMPVISKVEGNVGNVNNSTPGANLNDADIHGKWLRNALNNSQEGVQAYLRLSMEIRQAMTIAKNYTQYADLQNRMQHALSQCTNKLIKARKVMHQEFLQYLSTQNVPFSAANLLKPAKKAPTLQKVLPAISKSTPPLDKDSSQAKPTIIVRTSTGAVLTPLSSSLQVLNQTRPVLLKPPGSQPPILLRPTLTPITVGTANGVLKADGKPVLLNQLQPQGSVRLINSNVAKNSIVISQIGGKTVGNIVPATAATKNVYVKQLKMANNPGAKPVLKKATIKPAKVSKKITNPEKDPLAMSDEDDEETTSILQSLLQPDVILREGVLPKEEPKESLTEELPISSIKVEGDLAL